MQEPLSGEPFRVTAGERPAVLAHLLQLSADDRYGRFATSLSDNGIEDYVARINFARDIGVAITGNDGQVKGFIHLAVYGDEAELGASVGAQWRRQGIARQLFSGAVQLALKEGIREIHLATGHPVAKRIFSGMGYPCLLRATYPRGVIELKVQPVSVCFAAGC
jgi:GNAT superfamily N-acetyltransferase